MTRRSIYCLLAILPALPGCLHVFHEPPPIHPTDWRPADEVPDEAKGGVYVFLFDGHDAFKYCNMDGVRGYLNDLGFGKTYSGLAIHRSYFAEKLRAIHAHCPSARFAIVGFDKGAEAAQGLALDASKAGVPIDLLVYLEPKDVDEALETDLGTRTVTVWGENCGWCPHPSIGSEVMVLHKVERPAVPTHPQTLGLLEQELTLIGMGIPPVPRAPAPLVKLVEPLPSPRESQANPKALPREWQFLRLKNPWDPMQPIAPVAPLEVLPTPRVAPKHPEPKVGV